MAELYRAVDEKAYAGPYSHWTPSLSAAKQYTDNPGFGGSNLIKTSVASPKVLDLATGRPGREVEDLAYALFDAGIGEDFADSPEELAEGWRDSGYNYVFQVFENQRGLDDAVAQNWDWVTFTDDFPEGATTWLYLGTQVLPVTPISRATAPRTRQPRPRKVKAVAPKAPRVKKAAPPIIKGLR